MKLYLSSFRLGDEAHRLAELAEGAGRVAFVPNALDHFEDPAAKDRVVARGVDDLQEIGLACELLDLRSYFGSPRELRDRVSGCQAMFFTGGNVFVLRRALHQSGLDSFLQEKRNDRDFVYAGYSAGACVCGPSLRGLDLVDDPHTLPDGYLPNVIWDGLSLIDRNIAPHYCSDHPESQGVNAVVDHWVSSEIPFHALRDGEVLIQE